MKIKGINRLIAAVMISLFIIPILPACSNLLKKPKEKEKEEQGQKKDPPKILLSLENTTETMIGDIQKVIDKRMESKEEKKEEKEKEEKEKEKGGEKGGEGGNSGSGNTEQKDQSSGKSGQESKDKPKEEESKKEEMDWKKMQANVEKLQKGWSNYINSFRKDGGSNQLAMGYESQLDILTTKVMGQDETTLLDTTNNLYKFYPKFYDLYKHKAPPNIKTMKYYIRKIIIDSEKDEWTDTPNSIEQIEVSWDIAKARMEKPDIELNKKVETALSSFSKSTKEENPYLVKLKGNILIGILEEIK